MFTIIAYSQNMRNNKSCIDLLKNAALTCALRLDTSNASSISYPNTIPKSSPDDFLTPTSIFHGF